MHSQLYNDSNKKDSYSGTLKGPRPNHTLKRKPLEIKAPVRTLFKQLPPAPYDTSDESEPEPDMSEFQRDQTVDDIKPSDDEEDSIPILVLPEDNPTPVDVPYDAMYYGIRCAGCQKPLTGDAITTSNRSWHPACLKCHRCACPLEHIQYHEQEGLPYCALDYHELFSPRCDYCKTPIEGGRWLTALQKNYHLGHLFCRECGEPFQEGASYSEREGHVYCQKDHDRLFAIKCKGCEESISREYIRALDGTWHKSCFVCLDCGCAITSSTFMVKAGKPHCGKECQKKIAGPKKLNKPSLKALPDLDFVIPTLKALPDLDFVIPTPLLQEEEALKNCHRCHQSIQGRCFSAFGYDYHPIHFRCLECDKVLSERLVGLYEETTGGEIICKICARKKKSMY